MSEKRSIQIVTLGCSKNEVDSEHLLAQIRDEYEIVPAGEERDVDYLLLNTCGFIGDAKEESIQAILAAVERKNAGKVGKIFVFGCLSQRYISDMPALIPEVDGWFGARDIDPIVKALGVKVHPERRTERVRTGKKLPYAYLKISEGCDRRCSYCAIPFIRGAHRSVPIEELVKEATVLASEGIRELVLIAQDTTYYGLDLYHRRALGELLQRLSDMMHRHVDGAWTRALIKKMREKVPGIVLRTTMIVGHPGEGVKEFNELLQFVKEAKFERLGAFKYSEEDGTFDALNFKDSVMPKTKQSRLDRLMELQNGISFAFNSSRVGSHVRVIVDDFNDGVFVCRSEFESPEVDGEIMVRYDSSVMTGKPQAYVGGFMNVKIVEAGDYDLVAEFVSL